MGMLEELDAMYENTEAAKGGGRGLPDGNYEAEVTSCVWGANKFDGTDELQWAFRVQPDQPCAGRFAWKEDRINEQRMSYIKKDLETVELTLEKFRDLKTRAAEVEGSIVEIGVKNNYVEEKDKTYTNVYINKLIAAPSDAVPADDDADDLI